MKNELDKKFVKKIEESYRWYRGELRKEGISDIEIRAIVSSTYEMLGLNAKKLRDKAGL